MTSDRGCNPDDVVCEMEVLRHLKGLEEQLGHEVFLEKYPEAVQLRNKLPDAIKGQEEAVQARIDDCVNGDTPEEQEESRADIEERALDQMTERESLEASGEDE